MRCVVAAPVIRMDGGFSSYIRRRIRGVLAYSYV